MFFAAFTPPEVAPAVAMFALIALGVVSLIVAVSWVLLPWIIISKMNSLKMQSANSTSALMAQLLAMTRNLEATNATLTSILETLTRTGGHSHDAEKTGGENAYYFVRDGKTEGPINEGSLRKLFNAGVVAMDTPAMKRGDTDWRTIRDLFP